jgi:hypothetical protein
MAATYMIRRHLATIESASRPDAVAERRRYADALAKARDDRRREFPTITPANFEAADAFQTDRLAHWLAGGA